MKRKSTYLQVFLMGIAVSMMTVSPVMAAGPLADKSNTSYDEETWAKLQDNILEYEEIPLLIHEYNPTMADARENMEKAIRDLKDNADELRSHQRKMESLKDQAKGSGNDVNEIVGYATSEEILKQMAKGMEALGQQIAGNKNTIRTMQKAEEDLAEAVRKVMIMYDSARRQNQTLNQMIEMYDAQYQLVSNKYAQGMATESEVYAAQVNQLSAKSGLEALESSLLSMKPMLCYLTGWPADGNPEIGEVPPLNLAELGEINLEEDTRKAIGNNAILQEQRHSAKGKTNDGVKARLAMIEEGDEKLTVEMKRLYDDIFIKKTAYESAQLGLQSAQRSRDYYDRMYQEGMISRSECLAMQIASCQKTVAFQSADLELRQAINTYKAAVRGAAAVTD